MKQVVSIILTCILLLTACGQSSPTWQEQYDLGVRYLSEGNYEEAIIAFTAAIEIDPKQAPAYVGRGDAYIGSGETEENLEAALADYEKAVELDETCAEGYLGIADVYIRRGEFDKALEILKTGLEKTGNDQSIADKIAEMEEGNITDSSGNIRRVSYYDADGSLLYYFEYTYNEIGQESSVTSFDGGGNEKSHIDFEYDSGGNQTVSFHEGADGILYPAICTYNEEGQMIKQEYKHEDRMDTIRTQVYLYFYDEAGRKNRVEGYLENQLAYQMTIEYDSSGNIVRENYYDEQGEFTRCFVYEYDSNGNNIWKGLYSADRNLEFYLVTTYDEEGKKIQEDYYQDGELVSFNVYE